jgi:hypothetical protein
MNVCLAASCGNAYYTWSDQQINALIQPDGAPNGTYDITLCSHGEGYVASCVLYVVLPFLFQAPAAGAPTAGIFYQGGGNITGTTQNVVVGQQIALQGQASFGIPMSQGWNVGVTTFVGGYKASLQQGCLVDANATDPTACVTTFTQLTSSGQNFTFYFTPPTSGNVVVTYKATRPLGAVASASTTFAVVGPALVPNRGIAVGSGPGSVSLDMNGFLKAGALPVQTLHYGTNPPNAGIYFYDDNTTVTPPPGYPNAVFEFIQVVYNAFYFATPIAGGFASPPPICAGGVDDGHAPGQNWIFSLGNTDDSPTVPQSLMTKGGPMASIGATEDFMTFLMFDPKSPGSIPVPLGVISWNWGGQASSPDGGNTFVLNPISSVAVPNGPTKGQSNVFFPTWNFPCVPLGD